MVGRGASFRKAGHPDVRERAARPSDVLVPGTSWRRRPEPEEAGGSEREGGAGAEGEGPAAGGAGPGGGGACPGVGGRRAGRFLPPGEPAVGAPQRGRRVIPHSSTTRVFGECILMFEKPQKSLPTLDSG